MNSNLQKILLVLPWVAFLGLLLYLFMRPQDNADQLRAERDAYMEISLQQIKKADSLQAEAIEINKRVDSLKKVSRQLDAKLVAIKKYYEEKYTDVSNNTPTESYRLFTEYTDRGFSFPH